MEGSQELIPEARGRDQLSIDGAIYKIVSWQCSTRRLEKGQCVTNVQKRNKNTAENYRPVSLTSQCSKLMEFIIRDVIVEYLEANQLLKDSQHGFRTGRSCLTNILVFLDKITEWVDQGEVVDVVFLFFAKEFDKAPHQRLLLKVLVCLGIGGKLFDWISNWLLNHTHLYKWHCVCLEAGLKQSTTRVGLGTTPVFDLYN